MHIVQPGELRLQVGVALFADPLLQRTRLPPMVTGVLVMVRLVAAEGEPMVRVPPRED